MRSARHAVGISIFAATVAALACHCVIVQEPARQASTPSTQPPSPAQPPPAQTAPPAASSTPPAATKPLLPRIPKGGWPGRRRPGAIRPVPASGWIDCAPGQCGTPGKVSCGTAECTAGAEACCDPPDSSPSRCVPVNQLANQGTCCPAPGAPAGTCQSGSVPLSCDDSTDCPSGLLCCVRFGADGAVYSACGAGPCEGGELCSDKGGCSAGMRCAANPGAPGGTCRRIGQTMPCGALQCTGNTPYCKWNKTSKTGACAGPDPRGRSIDGHFECLTSEQCPQGESCCVVTDANQSYATCMSSCPAGGSAVACRNITDCPKDFGEAMGTRPKSCDAVTSDALPPGMKLCTYVP